VLGALHDQILIARRIEASFGVVFFVDLEHTLEAGALGLPPVSRSRVVLIGTSAGGLATVLAAAKLPGLGGWIGLDPVDRTGAVRDEIKSRLALGETLVLFAEGTSSDGNRVLPFRSALLGAIEDQGGGASILMQPMAITYIGQHGLPMGRQHRPLVAWYGDLDFMPHIRAFIERGAVDAVVTYGDPVPADRDMDRKAMSKRLEGTVRQLLVTALRGRPMSVESAS